MRLYEIAHEIDVLMAKVNPETGEITPGELAQLEMLEMQKSDKLINCAHVIKGLKADEKALAEEIEKLQKRKKAAQNHQEWLMVYMGQHMERDEKINSPTVRIRWQQNSKASVIVVNEKMIPPVFFDYKQTLSKARLGETLQKGTSVPGAHLQMGDHLRID